MSWFNRVAPGFKKALGKKDTPDNLWIKCPASGEMVFRKDVEANCMVSPAGHHFRIGPAERFAFTLDGAMAHDDEAEAGTGKTNGKAADAAAYEEIALPSVVKDPLRFRDDQPYSSRLTKARRATGREDAMAVAVGAIDGVNTVVLVQDFSFMGGSLGMAAGEAFLTACDTAVERGLPLVAFVAAGGARMQEGALSLMQMPRTVLGVDQLRRAGLPYIVVLTDPTTGGVTASYAMLGDVHIAEPNALIGFAGPRVIEQTIREKLPEGFQRAEYLLDHGMVDKVVDRRVMRDTLGALLRVMLKQTPKRPVGSNGVAIAPPEPIEPAPHGASPRPNGADDSSSAGA